LAWLYRRKYDAARTLATFARNAPDDLNLDDLTAGLVQVVNDTMQPQSIAVWLKLDKAGRPLDGLKTHEST